MDEEKVEAEQSFAWRMMKWAMKNSMVYEEFNALGKESQRMKTALELNERPRNLYLESS